MEPENQIHVKLRMYDTQLQAVKEFGKYDNMMLSDLNIKQLMTDLRKTYNKLLNEFEIAITNQKKGEL